MTENPSNILYEDKPKTTVALVGEDKIPVEVSGTVAAAWPAKSDPLPTHMVRVMPPGAVKVEICGHRFDPRQFPRHIHCQHCWFTYFVVNPGKVRAARAGLQAFGHAKSMFGKKGSKFFELFVQLIEAQVAKDLAARQATEAKAVTAEIEKAQGQEILDKGLEAPLGESGVGQES